MYHIIAQRLRCRIFCCCPWRATVSVLKATCISTAMALVSCICLDLSSFAICHCMIFHSSWKRMIRLFTSQVRVSAVSDLFIAAFLPVRLPVPWGHVCGKAWGDPASDKPVLALHGKYCNTLSWCCQCVIGWVHAG